MLKFLTKRIAPFIASNLDLDIDTVQKSGGIYLRIRVEVFGMVLLDRLIKISDASDIENPVDVFSPGGTKKLPTGTPDVLDIKALKDLK